MMMRLNLDYFSDIKQYHVCHIGFREAEEQNKQIRQGVLTIQILLLGVLAEFSIRCNCICLLLPSPAASVPDDTAEATVLSTRGILLLNNRVEVCVS